MEAAAQHDRLLAVASVGRLGDTSDPMGRGWLSRRHYLQVGLTRSLSIRGGRFLPVYGVWNGDASVATRTGLGWDHDTYNVEANWVTDRWSAAAAAIVADATSGHEQQGFTASGGVFFANKRKLWLSYLQRRRDGTDQQAVGLSGVVGIGSRAYLLTQADHQWVRDDAGARRRDLYANACLARETIKGLYVLLVGEVARRDLDGPGRLSHSEGAALRSVPAPALRAPAPLAEPGPGGGVARGDGRADRLHPLLSVGGRGRRVAGQRAAHLRELGLELGQHRLALARRPLRRRQRLHALAERGQRARAHREAAALQLVGDRAEARAWSRRA